MTAADLKTATLYLRDARFRGKRGLLDDTAELARKLLAELGAAVRVDTAEQLDALADSAVIRDGEGHVCEKYGAGAAAIWYAVRSTRARTPQLPAWVLDAGEEGS